MDDLIRRQDAAKILCNWCGVCPEDKRDIMNCDDICPEFAKIPSARQWFPWVENDDRLKDHYYYLVNHVGHEIPMLAKFHDDGCYFEIISMYPHKSIYVWDNDIITAWMPLPEIYKGETES